MDLIVGDVRVLKREVLDEKWRAYSSFFRCIQLEKELSSALNLEECGLR